MAEKFEDKSGGKTGSGPSAKVGRAIIGDEGLLGQVRFKITVGGLAANASDVANLIVKLEESPYFCLVYPAYSRSKRMPVPGSSNKYRNVSEFEIACYLANYRQGTESIAKQLIQGAPQG